MAGSVNGLPIRDYLYEDTVDRISFVERRFPGNQSCSLMISRLSGRCPMENNGDAVNNGANFLLACSLECSVNTPKKAEEPLLKRNFQEEQSEDSWFSTVSDHNCAFYIPPHLVELSNTQIREQLLKLGKNPGPVTTNTRDVYLKWLVRLQGQETSTTPGNVCSYMTNTEIRTKLIELGANPGPVTEENRIIYLKLIEKLASLISRSAAVQLDTSKPLSGYPGELRTFIHQPAKDWVNKFLPMDKELCSDFDQPNRDWREGNFKTAFNYLLLDPRITQNLPIQPYNPKIQMEAFVRAIFYVGKGSRSRPLSHLNEAHTARRMCKKMNCAKIERICEIWNAGYGVISLHCFQNVIPVEAYTREACIILALGLRNLTNVRQSECYGKASSWTMKDKCRFGTFLLYRALHLLINEGERQIRPPDLHIK